MVLAYRLLLGRFPENDEVVNNLCQTVHSVTKLRETFLSSAEFRQLMAEALGYQLLVRHRHPFNMPSIPVQVNVSEEYLSQMFERINQEWEFLGENDPYWSVLTQQQYHLDEFATHKEQFYRSGKYSSDLFLAALRRNNINPYLIELCVDFGCGVGRVTNFLAKSFVNVIAVDISSRHLNIAKNHLQSEGVTNVEFKQLEKIQSIKELPLLDGIFSVITMQHNPPPLMALMLEALLERLKPSGVAYLQIPTYRKGYLFEAERYLSTTAPKTLEMHFLPQFQVFKIIDALGCKCLEIREDGMVGEEDKMLSNTFLIQKNA